MSYLSIGLIAVSSPSHFPLSNRLQVFLNPHLGLKEWSGFVSVGFKCQELERIHLTTLERSEVHPFALICVPMWLPFVSFHFLPLFESVIDDDSYLPRVHFLPFCDLSFCPFESLTFSFPRSLPTSVFVTCDDCTF